ncbi:MAG: CpaF family protein, partial [Bacteriovoracaceae bacterium]|nr:CpaF family protein [Bacteriovoracaceae bacterium]
PTIKEFDTSPDVFGLSPKWIDFLKALVYSRCNIIVSGGTGVGKTTFLNLLLNEIPAGERVVTIEDTIELSFDLPNLVKLEARGSTATQGTNITIQDLVKNTLRMRPDRIIIGETRGGELFDLLQAMNTGHEGSMSTVHANSTSECLARFETLFMLAGYDVPYHVVRSQISSAIDFVIQLTRDREGKRIVGKISEVTGMETDRILLQDIGDIEDDRLVPTGITPKRLHKIHRHGGIELDFFNTKGF